MELKGKLLDIAQNIRTGAYQITLEAQEIPQGVDKLPEVLRINLTRWTNKRSMTANAYYWVLVAKLSKAMRRSEPWIHNWLLCDYGTPMLIDGKVPYVQGNGSGTDRCVGISSVSPKTYVVRVRR